MTQPQPPTHQPPTDQPPVHQPPTDQVPVGGEQKAAVYVTAVGLPDAWGVGDRIEVHVTQPDSPVEAIISVALDEARAWAADVYAAVAIAHREHTSEPHPITDEHLAALPDPGRVVFESLAGRWHQPHPDDPHDPDRDGHRPDDHHHGGSCQGPLDGAVEGGCGGPRRGP
jgi:hypothetical protein